MYLAHIDRESSRNQTLADHCHNVAAYCSLYGDKIGMKNTAQLIGLMHDAGKAKKEFMTYLEKDDSSLRGSVNHTSCGAKYIYERWQKGDSIQQLTAQMVALVICSHHGGLIDSLDVNGKNVFEKRIFPDKEIHYKESIENFFRECADQDKLDQLFQASMQEMLSLFQSLQKTSSKETLLFQFGLTVRFLLSCLLDADRWDTCLFMENRLPSPAFLLPELWDRLSERLEKYLQSSKMNQMGSSEKERNINQLRREISDHCFQFAERTPGIYQLHVPTGGGKTLSSIRFALHHAKRWNKERIFYVIPFKTILDQNANVIRECLGIRGEDVLLEHHSDIIWEEDEKQEKYKLLTERWDVPIILTTTVQFLNTLFLGKTQSVRRMHNLANSIIILDEVQALPVKCINMFNSAINFLSSVCGATVVLCTATQPLLDEAPVPLQLSEPSNMISDCNEKFSAFRRTSIVDKCIPGKYDTDTLTNFILDRIQEHNSLLTICNTKLAARVLFQSLQEENKLLPEEEKFLLYHLSTGMCPAHRKQILDRIRAELKEKRVVCISTQLVEAGVDLSFSCVIRSLAGLDSIAQAAGRCNRHGESLCQNVYLVNFELENLSHLPDIQVGADITSRVLREFQDDPGKFDNDLLSPLQSKGIISIIFLNVKTR